MLFAYLLVAYLIAPDAWKSYLWYYPFSDDQARITTASDGHPGDPLNVGLIDSERDYLMSCLRKTQRLLEIREVAGFHSVLDGHNGGGDPWHTDGVLRIGVITQNIEPPK